MSSGKSFAAVLFLSACLALCVCFVSANENSRFQHRAEVIYNQFAILKGQPHHIDGVETVYPQFQSRVLFPLLLKGAVSLPLFSVTQIYLLLRIATAWVAFVAFLLLCIRMAEATVKAAAFGGVAFAYSLIFTFNHGWEHPTDFLDVIFFSGFLWLSMRKLRIALALLVALGTLNHQTAAFASVVWFCLWGIESPFRIEWGQVAYSAALAAGSYSLSTAVRIWLSGTGPGGYGLDGWLTIRFFEDAMRHPEPFGWPFLLVAMIGPLSLWLWSNRPAITAEIGRLVWAAVLILALSSPIAAWNELRSAFLAPLVVATFAAVASEVRMGKISVGRDSTAF